MLRKLFCLCLLIAGFVSISFTANAANDPTDTVKAAIEAIKQTGDPAAMIEYVHWDTAFADLPAEQKKSMKVSSGAELKNFFLQFFKDPSIMIKPKIEEMKAKVPAEKQAQFEQQMLALTTTMQQKLAEAKEKLKTIQYEIGKATVVGDSASVPLTSTIDGKSSTKELKLINIDGKWYFPSLMLTGKQPGEPEPSTPSGK